MCGKVCSNACEEVSGCVCWGRYGQRNLAGVIMVANEREARWYEIEKLKLFNSCTNDIGSA